MMKLMIVGRRAAGRTRRGALDHLRDVHGKMVVRPPAGAGTMPTGYVQNHVIDGAYPVAGVQAIERDLVTELWFDSPDQMRASTQSPYYLANLKPDEPRFVDDESVARLMVVPRELRAGARGVYKLFLFATRGDASDDGWSAARAAAAAAFLAMPGVGAATENEVLAPPTGGPRFVDIVLEGWFAARDDALAPVDRLDRLLATFGAGAVDASRCFAVAAEEHDSARLRALHGCAA